MEALRSYFGPPVGLSRPRGFSSFLSGRNYRLGGASKWSPPARLTPPPWRPLRCAPSALPLDVSPPPIDGDPELKATEGAALEHCTAETFGDDNAAIDAAFNGVAIMDLSHFGRLRGIYSMLIRLKFMTSLIRHAFLLLLDLKVMEALNLGDIVEQPYGTHRHYNVNGAPLTIGIGSILSRDGFSFMLSPASARSVWRSLLSHGAIPMGANAWERLRVLKGRPAPGKELTKDYNVLEAGLSMAVHLDKGCYKGQETISRLITYNGVKQRLWGIKLSGQAAPGTSIMLDGKKVGVLTSYALGRRDGEHLGLGYAKRHVTPADEVFIGDVKGTLVDVPLLSYTKL
ncbi:putative transferase At1g60990, chloroplastic isoform X2 [Musa acuminata AAA Group]|uniref:putative transferase At1g60990, chloroplastic isoform X2 n=1 Tax=Musa acuminata AAA Group TaxID=214697 RepID=UPI0031DE2067